MSRHLNGVKLIYGVRVDAIGSSGNAPCATSAGLRLGDSREKVLSVYGHRYFLSSPSGNKATMLYQWHDGTTLEIHIGPDKKVVSMSLAADVE
jgi:hypothetical protein